MKRCPQCNSLYEDEIGFCLNDGQALMEENFALPSEEFADDEPTVIRQEPIIIDVNKTNAPTEQFNYQVPPTQNYQPIVIEKSGGSNKSVIYLLLGAILGGGLVLGTILLAGKFFQSKNAANNNQNSTNNSEKITSKPTPKATETTAIQTNEEHRKRTETNDKEFNGRVISENAFLRESPDRNSKQTDALPLDDRLTILNRENEGSPWYFVVCEHGTSGWIHGNSIEYTK